MRLKGSGYLTGEAFAIRSAIDGISSSVGGGGVPSAEGGDACGGGEDDANGLRSEII